MSVDNWGDWVSVECIGNVVVGIYQYSVLGGFNDFDMFYFGFFKFNINQEKLYFGFWVIIKFFFVLGLDFEKIFNFILDIIWNKGLIDINQDFFGKVVIIF